MAFKVWSWVVSSPLPMNLLKMQIIRGFKYTKQILININGEIDKNIVSEFNTPIASLERIQTEKLMQTLALNDT